MDFSVELYGVLINGWCAAQPFMDLRQCPKGLWVQIPLLVVLYYYVSHTTSMQGVPFLTFVRVA